MATKCPLVEKPDPNRVYLRREYRPAKVIFAKNTLDTFHVRPVNVLSLLPFYAVILTGE
jgi:hypothetical protein